jgi:hypothetical protein
VALVVFPEEFVIIGRPSLVVLLLPLQIDAELPTGVLSLLVLKSGFLDRGYTLLIYK